MSQATIPPPQTARFSHEREPRVHHENDAGRYGPLQDAIAV